MQGCQKRGKLVASGVVRGNRFTLPFESTETHVLKLGKKWVFLAPIVCGDFGISP